MSMTRRVLGVAAGAVGVAAAGTVLRVAQRRRIIARRGVGDVTPFGSLRSQPLTVVADDGVPLHVEVDEVDAVGARRQRHRGRAAGTPSSRSCSCTATRSTWTPGTSSAPPIAGWCARSSTTSAPTAAPGARPRATPPSSSSATTCSRVIDEAAPDGPVVLVGHSMGGMTIVALAEEHPELFGDRIVGVGLVGTTAGGVDPHRMVLPLLPSTVGGQLATRLVATLARGHRTVDRFRKVGHSVSLVATDELAFGDAVPPALRRVRRRDALVDAVRRGRGVLPDVRHPREVRDRARDEQRPDGHHLRHRGQADADRAQPQAARDDRGLHAARVRRRRPHGDAGAARPGQRRARPAARGRRGPGRPER